MDALTLGIGLQGKHDFSLDGLKYQIAAQEKQAAAKAKERKKAYDSWDDTMKKAVGMTDTTKIKPYLQGEAESDVMAFLDKTTKRRASGEFQGMDDIRDFMDLKAKLGRYANESAAWGDMSNVHPSVQASVMDRDGLEWLSTKGQYYGVNAAPDGEGGFINSYPADGMVDIDALEKTALSTIHDTALSEQIGQPTRYSLGEKNFARYTLGMAPDMRKDFEDDLYNKVTGNPMAVLSLLTRMGYEGGVNLDVMEAGPDGIGTTLKPKVQDDIRAWISSVADKKTRTEKVSDKPTAEKPSEFEKKIRVGDMTVTDRKFGKESSIPYFPKAGSQAPKSFEVTDDVMIVDNKSNTGLTRIDSRKTGSRVTGLEKSPLEITSRGGKNGGLYFEYTGAKETYYVPLSQKSFTEFILNSGDTPENVRDNLVKVNGGNDIAELKKYREFIGSAYTPAAQIIDEWKEGEQEKKKPRKTGASGL